MNKQLRVASLIEEKISKGFWKLHSRLPPERFLAVELGVSRNTLRAALQILHGRGILGSRQGSGNYVEASGKVPACMSRGNLACRLEGLHLVFPSVAALCARVVAPLDLLELERLLTPVGMAVQSGIAADFSCAQTIFLRGIAHGAQNLQLEAALEHLLPSGRYFSELFDTRREHAKEEIFACLARLLSSIRHKNPEEAAAFAADYTELLLLSANNGHVPGP